MKRLFRFVVAAALLAWQPLFAADQIVVLTGPTGHRSVVLIIDGPRGPEVALEEVAKGLDVSFVRQGRDAAVVLKSTGREVRLENGKSLFTVGGELKALPAPVRVVGDRTYVSPPAAAAVMASVLGQAATYRASYKALIIGGYEPPRLRLTNVVSPSSVECAIEMSKPVSYEVRREANRVVVVFQTDVLDAEFSNEALPGRIVASARFDRTTPPRLVFDVSDRFAAVHTTDRDNQHVTLVFDAIATGSPTPGAGPLPAPPPRSPSPPVGAGFKRPVVLVIDPGHGGEDVGAQGPSGHLEKDVTLALARRLRAAAVDSLSIQVFLTRDADIDVALDERAAIANNFNADIFLSLHANGSRAASASGTEVFFLSYTALDDEARRLAMQEGPLLEKAPASDKDVGLILWDMAQAAQLDASSRLAAQLQAEIAQSALSRSRGVKQAPFRVLVGATMPAALVEVGFITNPEEERLLFTESHQARLTDALVEGLGRFVASLRGHP